MGHVIRFGTAELRPSERRLRLHGEPVALSSRAFDLLLALAERPDRVVSKNDLLDIVWPGLVVEENNLQVHVSALRKLLGPQVITTVPGRGYQFTAVIEGRDNPGVEAVAARPVAPAAAQASMPGNIAPQAAPLIGRHDELRRLLEQVESHRLVSVVGAAGMGKTSLALTAALALKDRWADGAWFVALGPLNDPAQVPVTIAQTLRLSLGGSGPPADLLGSALEGRSLLVVLDNCEHLVDDVASMASALLQRVPGLRLLATSQELLNTSGEVVFKLGPLRIPDPAETTVQCGGEGAVRLFVERARQADPRFALRQDNVETVAEICRHLDGMPLAIELAAARVRVLGLRGVHERLGERFRLLTGGARKSMRRHQSLLAAFEWSHGLLAPDEQTVFRRLGVFVGGFTLPLCQAVIADDELDPWAVLDALAGLVDKSMVALSEQPSLRYALLETSRALALEKLAAVGETKRLVERHARVLLAHVEQAHERRHGEQGAAEESEYLQAFTPESDNLAAALTWACGPDGDAEVAIGLVAATAEPQMFSGTGRQALARLRSIADREAAAASLERATRFGLALSVVGVDRGLDSSTLDRALERAEHGCRQLGWQRGLYRVLLQRAWSRIRRQQLDDAQATLKAAVEIEQRHWPAWLRSDRFNTQAELAVYRGDFAGAIALQQSAASLLSVVHEPRRQSRATLGTTVPLNLLGRYQEAADSLRGLIDRARLTKHSTVFVSWAYGHLAMAQLDLGRVDDARSSVQQALPLWRADETMVMVTLVGARLAMIRGRVDIAMRLLSADPLSEQHSPLGRRYFDETLRLAQAAEPDASLRERWRQEGQDLDADALVALCRTVAEQSTRVSSDRTGDGSLSPPYLHGPTSAHTKP